MFKNETLQFLYVWLLEILWFIGIIIVNVLTYFSQHPILLAAIVCIVTFGRKKKLQASQKLSNSHILVEYDDAKITYKNLSKRYSKTKKGMQKLEALCTGEKPAAKRQSLASRCITWCKRKWSWQKKQKTSSTAPDKKSEDKQLICVFDFDADGYANQCDGLKQLVSALLCLKKLHLVVMRLKSYGGTVTHYGLAGNHLERLTKNDIPVHVCVDIAAASGGYSLASYATKIIAAPDARVGSIGVILEFMNKHNLLKKIGLVPIEITAGEDKRWLTENGKPTKAKHQKVQANLRRLHKAFATTIKKNRNLTNKELKKVTTGATWSAHQALSLKLVDEIMISDEYIEKLIQEPNHQVIQLEYVKKTNAKDKVSDFFNQSVKQIMSIFAFNREQKIF